MTIRDHKQHVTGHNVSFYFFITGVEYVIPSQGYACQLCQKNRKFFLSERSAKVDHCKSEDHYNQWKVDQPTWMNILVTVLQQIISINTIFVSFESIDMNHLL